MSESTTTQASTIAPVTTQAIPPKPGASTQTIPIETVPAAPTPDPRLAELEKATKMQARRAAEHAAAAKKLESEKAAFATERGEFEQWKKLREDRRRNPAKYLQADFGEKWYDTLTKYQLEGAPTGDLIASELDEREAKLVKQLDEREAKINQRLETMQAQEAERGQRDYEAKVMDFVKGAKDKFPLIDHFGEQASVLKEIQAHFESTTKRTHDGSGWIPGELLTAEQAASNVEKRIEAIGLKFKSREQPPSTEAGKPSAAAPREPTPQRRAMSTAVTASNMPNRPAARNEKDRMQAAIAAWDAYKTQ